MGRGGSSPGGNPQSYAVPPPSLGIHPHPPPFIPIFGFSFQIVPKPLLDDHPVLEDLYRVLGFDLGVIMMVIFFLRQCLRASNTRIRGVGSRADVASIRSVSKETWNKNEN